MFKYIMRAMSMYTFMQNSMKDMKNEVYNENNKSCIGNCIKLSYAVQKNI